MNNVKKITLTSEIMEAIREVPNLNIEELVEAESLGITAIKDFSKQTKQFFNNDYLLVLRNGKGVAFSCGKSQIHQFITDILLTD